MQDSKILKLRYAGVSSIGRMLVITIKNPPENMLNENVFMDLNSCRELILSAAIDSVIITGQGNIFSKGVMLEEVKAVANPLELRRKTGFANDFYDFIYNLEKPVIAAINGHCLGGGLELALACHIRLCSEKVRLGLPEVSNKIIPGLGGIQRLMQLIGEAKTLEMILLGDVISASEAWRLNIVNRLLPKENFIANCIAFARTIEMGRQDCIREVIRLIKMARSENSENNIKASIESFVRLRFGGEAER